MQQPDDKERPGLMDGSGTAEAAVDSVDESGALAWAAAVPRGVNGVMQASWDVEGE